MHCERYASLFHPPLYYLLSRITRISGIWNANTNTYLGPTHLRSLPGSSHRAGSHTLRSRCPALGARAPFCEARTADMCFSAGKNDDGKRPTGLGENWSRIGGNRFPLTHHGLLTSEGIEVCSSRATASGLRFVLDLISRLFSLPPTFTTSPDLSFEDERTDGRTRDPLSPTAG